MTFEQEATSYRDTLALGENPLMQELGRPAMEREQQEWRDLAKWRRDELSSLDHDTLNFDSYEPTEPAEIRRASLVQGYLDSQHDVTYRDSAQYELRRDRVALEQFGPEAVGSDDAFFTGIQKQATSRRDSRALMSDIATTAATGAVTGAAGEDAGSYGAWAEKAKTQPGYAADKQADYHDAWTRARQQVEDGISPYRGELAQVWKAMKHGGAGTFSEVAKETAGLFFGGEMSDNDPIAEIKKKDAGATAFAIYSKLDKNDKPGFMEALGILARTLPKNEQATFFSDLAKQGGRDSDDFVRNALNRFTIDGFQKAMNEEVIATRGPFSANSQEKEQAKKEIDGANEARNFASAVRQLERGTYDPRKFSFSGGKPGIVEDGIFAIPGAITTIGTAAIPFFGTGLSFLAAEGSAYDDLRDNAMARGADEKAATQFADSYKSIAAVPIALLEKIQAGAIFGKVPGFDAAFKSVGDKISNRLLRAGFITAGGTIAETIAETGQGLIPDLVQDIAHELGAKVPDAVWKNGKDGALDGIWAQSASTLITMFPLAAFGASGGLSKESRARAFAEATPLQLRAFGATEESIAGVAAAKGQGQNSLNAAVDNLMETRLPESEQAAAAVTQLQAEIKQSTEAQQALKDGLMVPRTVQLADGTWSVFSQETGEELAAGVSGADAFRVAKNHSALLDDNYAGRVASDLRDVLATSIEGAEIIRKQLGGENAEMHLNLGEEMDTAKMIALRPEREARMREQIALEDIAEGGDGSVVRAVLGANSSEFHDGVKTFINEIYAGAPVMTLFHEKGHELRAKAIKSGAVKREEELSIYRTLDNMSGDKGARFIPEGVADEAITEAMLSEAFSKLLESEVIRSGRDSRSGLNVPRGILSRNVLAVSRLNDPAAVRSFSGLVKSVRHFFGVAFSHARNITKGLKSGELNAEKYHDFMQRSLGLKAQDGHDVAAMKNRDEILGEGIEMDTPFSLGKSPVRTATTLSEAKAAAEEFIGKPIANLDDGLTATLSNNTLGKMVSESAARKSISPQAHAFSVANLDSLYANAIRATSKPDARGGEHIKAIHRYFSPFSHAGESLLAKLTVKEFLHESDGSRIYSVEAVDIMKPAGNWVSKIPEDSQSTPQAGFEEKLQQRIDEVKSEPAGGESASFSLGPERMAKTLQDDAISYVKDPKQKARIFQGMSRRMAALSRERDEIIRAFGKDLKRKAIEDPRKTVSINKEAAFREASRRAELEDEAAAKHGDVLSNDDLVKLKSQPVHSYLADLSSPLKGRLMSKSVAAGKGSAFFDPKKQGDYDGAGNVSRSVFGGDLAPDQAAQELFDNGLIKEPTADAMWQALEKESANVARFKDYLKAANVDMKAARETAKAESKTWKEKRLREEAKNYSPKARLLRAMGMFDGIIAALPISERGRIGGYTQLATLATDEARLEFLSGRIERADKVMEEYFKKEYTQMLNKLFERAKPKKGKPGEKPKGVLGGDIHALFEVLKVAREMNGEALEAKMDGLEAEIGSGKLTPEAQAHKELEFSMAAQIGNWKNRDAATRAAAVENLTSVLEGGYAKLKLARLLKREDDLIRMKAAQKAAGIIRAGRKERDAKAEKDRKWYNGPRTGIYSMSSFDQLLADVFGEKSNITVEVLAEERKASDAKEDVTQAKMEEVDELFREMSGGSEFKGMQLRYDLSQQSITVQGEKFSAMEAVDALMMYRQEDGKRHMRGQLDDNGIPDGKWHYSEEFMKELDGLLPKEAREVMFFLNEKYGSEYDRLNAVYSKLNGINLPRNLLYSPISVKPQQSKSGGLIDPTTGQAAGSSIAPGALHSRGHSIAEPEFKDAIQKYIAHTKQMEHYIAYAPFMDSVSGIMGNRDFANVVETKSGQQAAVAMRMWLQVFRDGGTHDAANQMAMNQAANKMMSNAAGAILAGRISVLAIQATQLGASLAEMPTASYLKRLGLLTAGQLDYSAAFQSDYIQRRLKVLPPAVRLAMQGLESGKPNQLKFAQQNLLKMIGGADAFFTAGTFAMIYDYELTQAKKAGMGDVEAKSFAMAEAEKKTDRVAQPTRLANRSLFENTLTNPLAKMSFMFASEARQKLALAMWAVASKDMPAGRRARAVTVTWLIGGMVATLIRAAMRDVKDDDEDNDKKIWSPKKLLLASLTGPLHGIPLFGDALETGSAIALGETSFDGSFVSNITQGVQGARHLIKHGAKNDIDETLKDVDRMIGALGVFNETMSAASSLTHLARDVFDLGENVVKSVSK